VIDTETSRPLATEPIITTLRSARNTDPHDRPIRTTDRSARQTLCARAPPPTREADQHYPSGYRDSVPLQNRVTPYGDLIAAPEHGLVYGNRGCLHGADGRILRHHAGRRWIACRLAFRGWHRAPLLQPGRFTELFFLDEATAWAAGHRPCALCRRSDYDRFVAAWEQLHPGERGADAIDVRLHAERLDQRRQRRHRRTVAELPDATMIDDAGVARVVLGSQILRWTPAGYVDPRPRNDVTEADVLTPPSLVAVLATGWSPEIPLLHPSRSSRDG
jgi:hypothetical protein